MAAEFLERMGERMRGAREAQGLSRAELARLLPGKVNENQIYRWENGQHRPRDDTLEALAKTLKVDVSYFLAAEPTAPAPELDAILGGSQLDRIEQKVNRLLACLLTPEQRRGFEDLEALAAELAPARESQRQHRRRA